MVPILASLATSGLGLLFDFVRGKGTKVATEYILDKTGIDISAGELDETQIVALKQFEMEHTEELIRLTNETKKIVYGAEAAFAGELTKRHMYDMKSDSWLSKNVRPMSLIALLGTLIICTFVPIGAIDVAGAAITILTLEKYETLAMLCKYVFGYYFIGRTTEKGGLVEKIKDAVRRRVN